MNHLTTLSELLQRSLSSSQISPQTLKALAGTTAAVIGLRLLNTLLNNCALNNFTTDSYDWDKEIVLITGGSSGIGEITVHKLAKRGVKVVVLDLNPPKKPFPFSGSQDGDEKSEKKVWFYTCDITSPEAVRGIASRIYADVGHPTVLINNAGIARLRTILDSSPVDITTTLAVNTTSHFWTVQTFLPHMIQRNHGHVVTLASMASFVTIAGNVDYSCSKAAALAFHEGLVEELRHRYGAPKVRASIIHPFWARTPLTDRLRKRRGFSSTRTLDPECIADAVVERVMSGRSGSVCLPWHMGPARSMRGWPAWAQYLVRRSQAKSMMN